jgi:hydrophobe/amphiphile efflux-1 (HAE1) family protein
VFARFFIHRPVFAIVLSLFILIAGGVSIRALPVAQYPQITPPTVEVETVYVGANARTVEEFVATPIEQELNGAEGMTYLSSNSSSDGRYVLTCTFRLGMDPDIAAVDVQNRLKKAEGSLPPEVRNFGISVKKTSPDLLMAIPVSAAGGAYDDVFLSNFATLNLIDPLQRVPGVGLTRIVGQRDYAVRLWVRPDRLAKVGVTAGDLAGIVREQNVQAAAGLVGQPPTEPGTDFQYSVDVQGRLTTPEEYDEMIVRTRPDGSILRMKDVARTELGARDYKSFARRDGRPAVAVLVYQLPDANALDVADGVRATLDELSSRYPPGLEVEVAYDRTKFVRASIDGVIATLVEAIALVLVVVFLFLGSLRATFIPMLAVPVSIVGTFAAFVALGFSINTLTLFGLVLAIGIVVDDAIVVVEAVEHHIERGLSPAEATERAMAELSGPVVAIALVLVAVFVPVSFLGGITGELYRQFAIAVAVSVTISALVALTLTPALCRLFLRPRAPARGPVGFVLRWFNRGFEATTRGYVAVVRAAIRRTAFAAIALVGCYALAGGLGRTLPTSFVPEEDQGFVIVAAVLPDGASLERTGKLLARCEEALSKEPAVESMLALGGLNVVSGAFTSNNATMFVVLKDWKDRASPEDSADALIARLRATFAAYPEGVVLTFSPPPIPGLGTAGGFQFELQDQAGRTPAELSATARQFVSAAAQRPELVGVFTPFSADVPQVDLRLDRDKCKALGIPVDSVLSSLQTYLGGLQVNDTTLLGRTYKVVLQAESRFRTDAADIRNVHVRAADGSMVPLGTLVTIREKAGADVLQRFNLFRTAEITGAAAPGFSSGEAIRAMEETARAVLPRGYGFAWTGTAYQEKQSSGGQSLVFGLALAFVFLFLAALYESWTIPFGVILAIPLGILGAFAATWLRGTSNDVYVQIGIVVLIGLAAKNAILIVEFAKARRDAGADVADAATEAARLRLRPIVMTALAFILGVVPLVRATGAGAAARQSMGTAVFGGMLVATALGVVLIPVLYVAIERLVDRVRGRVRATTTAPEPSQAATAS